MVATADEMLGIGQYTPAEAAMYLRVNTATASRWMFGDGTGERVLTPHIDDPASRIITFVDLVQMMAVRVLRVEHKMPLDRIRRAVETARETYQIPFPFAVQHSTYLFGDQIVIRRGEGGEPEGYVQVSGKNRRNLMIPPIVELYMRDLAWNEAGLADHYTAWRDRDYPVVMNPRVRLGEPLMPSCGYTPFALSEAARTEGGIERAAKAYGVKPEEVEVACRYFDHLQGKTAA